MSKIKLTPLQAHMYNRTAKQGKYKSRGVYRDGVFFHSTGEADYYDLLKIRLKAGEIKGFTRQVKMKITINAQQITSYVADFVVELHDGNKQVLDYKSDFTRNLDTYKIKKKLLMALYNINIIEVGANLTPLKKKK